ncbi:MAG: 30S ribosome-binding factor RbfA [Oscillospiraceae bacterium]|nr:30S ribosome-binding factor RbfA [Oscillospiraceae bacterium]
MAGNRLERINEEIQRELAVMLRELKDPRVQGMVTITSCAATGDLKFCKVYVSVLEQSREKEVIKGLKSASGWLRRELGARLKLRAVPQLVFAADDSIRHGAHINQMLKDLED